MKISHFSKTTGGGMDSLESAREEGSRDGFQLGWTYGYHLGRCESIMRNIPAEEFQIRDVKVLYVTAGIGVPYPALDQAIIDALGQLVRELVVANPSEDIAGIAGHVNADLVIVLNGVVLPAEQVAGVRKKGIKTAVWFTDDPYYTDWTAGIAPRYDYVFTLELSCLPFYRVLGCPEVHYLPFAVSPKYFYPKPVDTSHRTDICFIGTAYWNRVSLIDRMSLFLSAKKVLISGWWWDRLQNFSQLADKIRLGEWMTPEDTSSCYNGAKIVINLHRSADDTSINANGRKMPAHSLNPRTFEISACGTLQFTDVRRETGNFYKLEEEIVTYTSPEELMDKIEYYLQHEEERRTIALSGLRRTMLDHTYHKRLIQMLDIIFKYN